MKNFTKEYVIRIDDARKDDPDPTCWTTIYG